MLDGLRTAASGVIGRTIFALLIVGLGAFGITFQGGSGNNVAVVGSVPITFDQYQAQYNNTVTRFSNQMGTGLTRLQQEQFQMPQITLQGMVRNAALVDTVQKLGIGVSDNALRSSILADPDFQLPNGTFDRGRYNNLIQNTYGSEAAYLQVRRPSQTVAQLTDALIPLTGEVSNLFAATYYQFVNETRTIDFIRLTEANLPPVADPTEEDIAAYYEAHQSDWNAPEARVVRILDLSPAALADPAVITDEALRAAYDARGAEFGSAETRHIWQQVLNGDQAAAVQAQLDAGQTFDQLVQAGTIAPSDVGTVPQSFFSTNPAIADAAFALDLGGTTIADGRFGRTLVHVSEIFPGTIPPFDEVAETLRQRLAEEAAAERIPALREGVEDARAAGANLEEVAEQFSLPIATLTFDRQGNDALGNPIADIPGGTNLVAAVFRSDVGMADPTIAVSGGAVWYEVAEIVAPHPRPLEEVHDLVAEAWRADQVSTQIQDLAQALLQRARGGEDLAAIAAEVGSTVETRADLRRDQAPDDVLAQQALLSTFNGPLGYAALSLTPDGNDMLLLKVVDVSTPTYDPDAEVDDMIALRQQDWSYDVLAAFQQELLTRYSDFKINTQLILDITGININQPTATP